jgi:hypothetical protein
VNVTPFEPECGGFATLGISNATPLQAGFYANEGLCRILSFRSHEACEIGSADRKGKYQKQKGLRFPGCKEFQAPRWPGLKSGASVRGEAGKAPPRPRKARFAC